MRDAGLQQPQLGTAVKLAHAAGIPIAARKTSKNRSILPDYPAYVSNHRPGTAIQAVDQINRHMLGLSITVTYSTTSPPTATQTIQLGPPFPPAE